MRESRSPVFKRLTGLPRQDSLQQFSMRDCWRIRVGFSIGSSSQASTSMNFLCSPSLNPVRTVRNDYIWDGAGIISIDLQNIPVYKLFYVNSNSDSIPSESHSRKNVPLFLPVIFSSIDIPFSIRFANYTLFLRRDTLFSVTSVLLGSSGHTFMQFPFSVKIFTESAFRGDSRGVKQKSTNLSDVGKLQISRITCRFIYPQ